MATANAYVRVENLRERAIANQEYVTNKSEFNGCCGQIESVESSKCVVANITLRNGKTLRIRLKKNKLVVIPNEMYVQYISNTFPYNSRVLTIGPLSAMYGIVLDVSQDGVYCHFNDANDGKSMTMRVQPASIVKTSVAKYMELWSNNN